MKDEKLLRAATEFFRKSREDGAGVDGDTSAMCDSIALGVLTWVLGESPNGDESIIVHDCMNIAILHTKLDEAKEN